MCNSCNASYVKWGNLSAVVHERGCPEAHKDQIRECKECGCEFTPDHNGQEFCSDHCYCMHWNLQCDCEFCEEIALENEEDLIWELWQEESELQYA